MSSMKNWLIVILVFLIIFFGLILFGRAYGGNESLVTLYVGPQTGECKEASNKRCLRVKYSKESEYQNFNDDIVGFSYNPGYEYEILVEKQYLGDVPADSSSFQYQYVSTINKSEKQYLQVISPQTGENIRTSEEFVIKGSGRGLFENNVVVEMVSESGKTWGPNPTVMETEVIGGEGSWELDVAPLDIEGEIRIRAFSPSPKDGESPIEDVVTIFGVSN